MKKPPNIPKLENEDVEREFWEKIALTDVFEPKDFQKVSIPTFKMSKKTEKAALKAIKEREEGKAVVVEDLDKFFANL